MLIQLCLILLILEEVKGPALFTNYRSQWSEFSTSIVSLDIPIDKIYGGLGLLFLNDKAGVTNSNIYGLSYAYSFKLLENFSLRAGLEGSYISKSIDWTKLTFGNMNSSRNGFIYEQQALQDRVGMVDFSSGLLLSGKKINIGFAVHHLTEPNESFIQGGYSPLPRKYSVHGSLTLNSGSFSFSPHVLFMSQKPSKQVNIGCYVNKGLVSGGMGIRITPYNPDALIFSLGLKHKYFRIGYSYDLTISSLGMKFGGSHEGFLAGVIPSKKGPKKQSPANLPIF